MKLIRFGEVNKEKTGIILNDEYYDTSSFGEDYNEQFFGSGWIRTPTKNLLNRIEKSFPLFRKRCAWAALLHGRQKLFASG